MHFDLSIRNVDDPVLRNPGAGIDAALVLAVERQRGIGHLDGNPKVRRLGQACIVRRFIAANDRAVRFGLAFFQRNGTLNAKDPTGREQPRQAVVQARGDSVVWWSASTLLDDVSLEQLYRVALADDAAVVQRMVLLGRDLHHNLMASPGAPRSPPKTPGRG